MTGIGYSGMQFATIRYQNTVGGGITTTASALQVPLGTYTMLRLLCYWDGANYAFYGYRIGEDGSPIYIGVTTGNVAWMPVAGRVGLFFKELSTYGFWDLFYNTFT